jgi:hypothetical protein
MTVSNMNKFGGISDEYESQDMAASAELLIQVLYRAAPD